MRWRWIIVLFALVSSTAKADNYEGYTSVVEGVGLWWLHEGDPVVRRLRFGENPEFAMYCNGKNKLYVYEKGGRGFVCTTLKWDEWQVLKDTTASDRQRMLRIIRLARKDRFSEAGQTEYFVSLRNLKLASQGIVTVSKKPLLNEGWTLANPTQDEIKQASTIASINTKRFKRYTGDYTYQSVLGYSNSAIKKMASREKNEWYTAKIKSRATEVILIPTLYENYTLGGDLISTVVLHKEGTYHFVGHIRGCLLSVGADIDADGFPEVITESCDGAQNIHYFKIFPTIKSLILYKHN